jgi:hypothetical protein
MLHISEWLAHLLPPARDVVPDPLRHVGRALALPAARVRRGRRLLDLDGLRHGGVGWDADAGVRERWVLSLRCSRALLYARSARSGRGTCAQTSTGSWECAVAVYALSARKVPKRSVFWWTHLDRQGGAVRPSYQPCAERAVYTRRSSSLSKSGACARSTSHTLPVNVGKDRSVSGYLETDA